MTDCDGNEIDIGDIVYLLDPNSPEYDPFFWVIIRIDEQMDDWPIRVMSLDGKYSDSLGNRWIRLIHKRSKLLDLVVKF